MLLRRSVRLPWIALLGLVACATERAGDPVDRPELTWRDDIAPVVAARCGTCHGGDAPAGGYDLTSYLGALGTGDDDVADAIAGDPASRILTELEAGDAPHDDLDDVLALLRRWVVDDRLAYFDSPLHPPGILDPANGEFHGDELRARAWDFALCASCHSDDPEAEDFAGGAADRACTTCHEDGPTACTTCHDESTGAHPAHLVAGELDRVAACADCHDVPARWDAAGHLDDSVEVRLDAPGTYDAATKTCSGVYCHGGTLDDPAAMNPSPTWTADGDQASCGGCHGLPPESHAGAPTACATCHGASFDGGALVTTFHLDGVTDVGDRSGDCGACHGDATSPAPPRALDGATATTALGVGAHRGHLARSALRGPMACNECHVVPADVAAAAHLDGDLIAEVFPAGAGVLARDDGADPTWDRATGTCSGVYCHGAATPRWTALGQGEAACGTCHGVPPDDAFHVPTLTLGDCHDCHSPSVDPFGNILFTGDDSEHLDGDVDF